LYTWLEGATPRSSADAVPLLILAKDLLRRLVSKEITFFDDRAGVLEARVRHLFFLIFFKIIKKMLSLLFILKI